MSFFALILSRSLAAEVGISIVDHVVYCIQALREHADALGLRGSL